MTIKVTERDDSRMFHRESDAHDYKAELEKLEAQKRRT